MIVRERLTGAHFVFPGEPSLAVRVYYPINIQAQEKASSKVDNITTRQALKLRAVHEPSVANESANDIDGIRTFCMSFKFSLILFVLPRDYLKEQLERMESFTSRVMHLVEESCVDSETKVIVVENTEQAISAICSVADFLSPAKSKLKGRFLERQQQVDLVQTAVTAFRDLGKDLGLVAGETELLMRLFGSLENIASASEAALQNTPCETHSKQALWNFFNGSASSYGADDCKEMITPEGPYDIASPTVVGTRGVSGPPDDVEITQELSRVELPMNKKQSDFSHIPYLSYVAQQNKKGCPLPHHSSLPPPNHQSSTGALISHQLTQEVPPHPQYSSGGSNFFYQAAYRHSLVLPRDEALQRFPNYKLGLGDVGTSNNLVSSSNLPTLAHYAYNQSGGQNIHPIQYQQDQNSNGFLYPINPCPIHQRAGQQRSMQRNQNFVSSSQRVNHFM